jgi:hypothetical protein
MPLTPGFRIGVYEEVIDLIAIGGRGGVYRARRQQGRDVAIEILIEIAIGRPGRARGVALRRRRAT